MGTVTKQICFVLLTAAVLWNPLIYFFPCSMTSALSMSVSSLSFGVCLLMFCKSRWTMRLGNARLLDALIESDMTLLRYTDNAAQQVMLRNKIHELSLQREECGDITKVPWMWRDSYREKKHDVESGVGAGVEGLPGNS